MVNLLRPLAEILENALTLFWALIFVAILLAAFKKKKGALIVAGSSAVWLFCITVSPLPQYLIYKLESGVEVFDARGIAKTDSVYILVLGGGHTIAPELPATGQLTGTALSRLTEAIRISQLLPASVIVTSGFSTSGRTTQSHMLKAATEELGLLDTPVKLSPKARNTKEEVNEYLRLFGHRNHRLIVVTSAWHMKRATACFHRLKLSLYPAPTDYYIKDDPMRSEFDFYPSAQKVQMMNTFLHEYLGMLELELFK